MEKRPFQQHISNEDTAKLPAVLFEGPIVIVDDEKQVEAACRDLASSPVLGFDTETRPSFKAPRMSARYSPSGIRRCRDRRGCLSEKTTLHAAALLSVPPQ